MIVAILDFNGFVSIFINKRERFEMSWHSALMKDTKVPKVQIPSHNF